MLFELGGKASAITLDDANLDKAAIDCALGSFMNVRIIYHKGKRSVEDMFTDNGCSPVKFVYRRSAL